MLHQSLGQSLSSLISCSSVQQLKNRPKILSCAQRECSQLSSSTSFSGSCFTVHTMCLSFVSTVVIDYRSTLSFSFPWTVSMSLFFPSICSLVLGTVCANCPQHCQRPLSLRLNGNPNSSKKAKRMTVGSCLFVCCFLLLTFIIFVILFFILWSLLCTIARPTAACSFPKLIFPED